MTLFHRPPAVIRSPDPRAGLRYWTGTAWEDAADWHDDGDDSHAEAEALNNALMAEADALDAIHRRDTRFLDMIDALRRNRRLAA